MICWARVFQYGVREDWCSDSVFFANFSVFACGAFSPGVFGCVTALVGDRVRSPCVGHSVVW